MSVRTAAHPAETTHIVPWRRFAEQDADVAAQAVALSFDIAAWQAASAFIGEPPAQRWLVIGSIPLGVAGVVAAAGDVGKTFLLLELGLQVSCAPSGLHQPIFGGSVKEYGAVVILTSEDGKDEIHRRLNALDPDGARRAAAAQRLHVVPLPDAGGPFPIVVEEHGRPVVTAQFETLRERLKTIPDLRLVVFDTLQTFVHADINADPMAAQFVGSHLAQLAAELGCTVLVAHHARKSSKAPSSLAEARELIRGSSAIVDSLRFAIVLWYPDEDKATLILRELGMDYVPAKLVLGGVVKSNGPADRRVWTLVRSNTGLLLDYSDRCGSARARAFQHLDALEQAIEFAAADGHPFAHTGENGVYRRRSELSEELSKLSRNCLENMCNELLESQRVHKAKASGSNSVKWLDVPGGPFALGHGMFIEGASKGRRARVAAARSAAR